MTARGLSVNLKCYKCDGELELWYRTVEELIDELDHEIADMGWEETNTTGVYVCDDDRNYN